MTETVLRVLNGRLAGTDKPLPARSTVSIGHEFWQDVVIRDAATKGIAVELTVADGAAQLMVLSGEAQLLGSRLAAGQTALLPPFVPFSIGGVALAWGAADSERWTEAGGLAESQPAPPALPPALSDRALASAAAARGRVGNVLGQPRLIIAGAVALAAVLMLIMIPSAMASLELFGKPEQRAQRALGQAGVAGLTVQPDGSKGVVVSGIVANDASRQRAQSALADAGVPALLRLRTNGELADATADLARIHGVPAAARPLGLRVVELRTVPIDEDRRDQLVDAIRTDVPGIRRLVLRGDLPLVDDAPVHSVSDAVKKVSTVISGDPSYIQTVDGARYFPGATLPSGHRLVGIRGNVVVIEKGGRETQLAF